MCSTSPSASWTRRCFDTSEDGFSLSYGKETTRIGKSGSNVKLGVSSVGSAL